MPQTFRENQRAVDASLQLFIDHEASPWPLVLFFFCRARIDFDGTRRADHICFRRLKGKWHREPRNKRKKKKKEKRKEKKTKNERREEGKKKKLK